MTFEAANDLMTHDPEAFQAAVQSSLQRHLAAVQALRLSDGLLFFDYGNAFLLECHRAGCEVDPEIPSYVGAYPSRLLCLSVSACVSLLVCFPVSLFPSCCPLSLIHPSLSPTSSH